jgi:flagellar basal-body rod modification protein FlgD
MQVSTVSAPGSTDSSLLDASALGRDQFTQLLVSQLKNQDPLEPAKNEQMIAQLAQFSSLEQMQKLNDNVVGLAVLQQSNALLQQLTSSSSLIGREVEYTDPTSNTDKWGTVESVRIEDGVAVLRIDGASVPLSSIIQLGAPPAASSDAAGS